MQSDGHYGGHSWVGCGSCFVLPGTWVPPVHVMLDPHTWGRLTEVLAVLGLSIFISKPEAGGAV